MNTKTIGERFEEKLGHTFVTEEHKKEVLEFFRSEIARVVARIETYIDARQECGACILDIQVKELLSKIMKENKL